ncbi:MAG: glycosyltransferase family 1 protein, partial [Acidobacteriota bacterium]
AHARLPDAVRRAHPLVLVGGAGWHSDALRAKLARAGDGDGDPPIRWLGHVDDAELPALYAAASMLAYPSLEEGFGLPVLEAMACGCPVLTSDRGALREVVGGGDFALRVDPTDVDALCDGLHRLLTDDALALALRQRGPDRAAHFAWSRTARETRALYRRIAARP